jgi:hypothetical protein
MAIRSVNATGGKPNPTFSLNEGTFTVNNEMLTNEGNKTGGSFASMIKKGMEVEIDTTYDTTVKPYSSGISIGIVGIPEGELPKATLSVPNYVMRIASVDVDGELDWIKMADTHVAVTPGLYLANAAAADEYVVEEDTTTNIIALQGRAENETGYILVLRRGKAQKALD